MLSLMQFIMRLLSDEVFYTELELLCIFFLIFEFHKFIFKYGKMASMLDFDFCGRCWKR